MMSNRNLLPKSVSDFKELAQSNIGADSSEEGRGHKGLWVQLIEVNTDEPPIIGGFSAWTKLGGADSWYICNNGAECCTINLVNDRVWAVYSLGKTESFDRTMNSWIDGNLLLDNCWTVSGSIRRLAESYSDDGTESELCDEGRITVGHSDDIDSVISAIGTIAEHYHNELELATKLRNGDEGSFEFEFARKVSLGSYERFLSKGARDLKMLMVKTEDDGDFVRFGGVDTHTWGRILLDMGLDSAYMTIPGNGCVNAVPRLAAFQGKNGGARIYYNGDEIFV